MRPDGMRLDEPTNHLDMATKEMLVAALAALSHRVVELTPEGVDQYGGGYTEYVARTSQEAPGLHRRATGLMALR